MAYQGKGCALRHLSNWKLVNEGACSMEGNANWGDGKLYLVVSSAYMAQSSRFWVILSHFGVF